MLLSPPLLRYLIPPGQEHVTSPSASLSPSFSSRRKPSISLSASNSRSRDASPEFHEQDLDAYEEGLRDQPLQLLLITNSSSNSKARPGNAARSRWCSRKVPEILSCHLAEFTNLPVATKNIILKLQEVHAADTHQIAEIVSLPAEVIDAVLQEGLLPEYSCFEQILSALVPKCEDVAVVEIRDAQDTLVDKLELPLDGTSMFTLFLKQIDIISTFHLQRDSMILTPTI